MKDPQQGDRLIALAERTEHIMAHGNYRTDTGAVVTIAPQLAASIAATELVAPHDWDGILTQAQAMCPADRQPCPVHVTNEATLAALERLSLQPGNDRLAALNFASARKPGGGWKGGAMAQEETLARASGLVATLDQAPEYYRANRQQDSLLYTDHAIWSPAVPFFVGADDQLLAAPYTADVITMPAPNPGGMVTISEQTLHELVVVWRRRIRDVLALAITRQVRHLVLGAWGCGVFANDPLQVARWFAEALHPDEPWRRGLDNITFAIFDLSKRRASFQTFATTLAPLTTTLP